MSTATLDERLETLVNGINALNTQIQYGQVQVIDPLVTSHVLPMIGDLVGCVALLHEMTDDHSDELAEPVLVLINTLDQLVREEVLPLQWQGTLLFAMQPTLEALGIVNGVQEFRERFAPQIAKLEQAAAASQQQQSHGQGTPA